MKVQHSGVFKRRIKKPHPEEKKSLDNAIKKIIGDPNIGEMKTGDLSGIQVYKYKYNSQQILVAYQFIEKEKLIILIALGFRENFYRDLKLSESLIS
ncbi:MAG: type II toxin-antitoxin system RelE/ParE family toxin [Candidatus Sedimenticola sp. (ex Thyasira tokunagai)]